jgi:hypothetical protein
MYGGLAMGISITKSIWDEVISTVQTRWTSAQLEKPIVFAMYTPEDDYKRIIGYREIPTVKISGSYPNGEYKYTYPGVKAQGFYPPKGTGKWFSGILVAGDGTRLDDLDKRWMIREQVYFRIKVDKGHDGKLFWKTYFLDFPEVSLDFE